MANQNICPNCKSKDIAYYLTVPERTEGQPIGKCKECGTEVKQGKSIFTQNTSKEKVTIIEHPYTKQQPNEANIHFKVRREFNIPYREYYYECFEGSYIYEFIDFAIQSERQEVLKKVKEIIKEKGSMPVWAKDVLIKEIDKLEGKHGRL